MNPVASVARDHSDIQKESRERVLSGEYNGLVNRSHWGYRYYVTPAWAVRDFLLKNQHILQAEYSPPQTAQGGGTCGLGKNPDEGWREVLTSRMTARFNDPSTNNRPPIKQEAFVRRLYGVMSGEQRTINAEWADAVCLVVGLDIDRDAKFPILPGNRKLAKELLIDRAEFMGIDLSQDKVTLQRMAHVTLRLCQLIVGYPQHTERIQNLAPLDCLRPPS